MPTWELVEYSEDALQQALREPGHYTLKVDPLVDKRLLHDFAFYYCDTLLEPHCARDRLRIETCPEISVSRALDQEHALAICHGAFQHGRFHRDFNLPKEVADRRYDNWLKHLLEEKQVYGLYWQGVLAGFVGCNGNSLVLHALAEKYRGKGLSKYWWSAVCVDLLALGHEEVRSSISASNLAALNLYASLGFIFKNPLDVYHRVTP